MRLISAWQYNHSDVLDMKDLCVSVRRKIVILVRQRTDLCMPAGYSCHTLIRKKIMKTLNATNAVLLIATTFLAGCISSPPQQSSAPAAPYSQSNGSRFGVIDSIDTVRASNSPSGAGLVVGGLVGGILGNQVGGGNGKTAATVIGAVGGAVVGNNIEQNRNAQSADRYQINLRMDHGDRISILQDSVADLRNGDRVRVIDGHVYRD